MRYWQTASDDDCDIYLFPVAVDQSLLGRIFGYGNIVVTGSGETKETFSHIQAPLEFRRAVQSVADKQITGET